MSFKPKPCFIYRCSNKPDMYIYLAKEDTFDNVPKEIYNSLGIVEFCMELNLTDKTKLAREDTRTVLSNLEQHSFHLQLPNHQTVDEIMTKIAHNYTSNHTKS